MTTPAEPRALRPWDRHPHRIGVINDFPGVAGSLADDWFDGIRLAVDEASEHGLLDRPVELVRRDVYGHPYQSGLPMAAAYRELVAEEQVLGVIGPMKSDDSLSVRGEVERLAVPLISMCGSASMVGPRVFVLNQGSLMDEPPFMLRWMRRHGIDTCAVLAENNQIGHEYLLGFMADMAEFGVSVVSLSTQVPVDATVDRLAEEFRRFAAARPQALVYLGLGHNNTRLNPALDESGWAPPVKLMTTAFVTASMGERWANALDGWVGVDQFHEDNPEFVGFVERFEKVYGRRPANAMAPCGFDLGATMARGLARARFRMPEAVADGLERVRLLPAAAGAPGTYITLGPWEHRGYRGDYLVMRRSVGGRTELA
ncbi:ABC transporter substrate-binding protein [Cryptosporangium aurantiacum]|uniref:ABC-type branched-chain amino acid transport system, substrate-binding protein n=1 Tax=Cryptosporangium aurantiacum TaxID=134849 RepID=A0A1M7R4Q6_9ACTN|nr:ABC transporter substrate-binding protein [Cryptosporangium aurantiacum]SHN40108.1 ABC-type branched-chain amino acid transport system, substrate-binding protein [Cryptosporangium aurantiacum]